MEKSDDRLPRATVERIAALAQLELSEREVARYQAQLSDVLAYFNQLAELDIADGQAEERPALTPEQLREDIAGAPLTLEQALANAPEQRAGQFRVPAVLPEND